MLDAAFPRIRGGYAKPTHLLDRLTQATNGATGGYGTVTYSYNQIGNLLNNSQVGRYTYNTSGASSTRPHAVTRAGTTTYSYDANGNLTAGGGRTLTWDAENRPTRIVKGGVTTTFVYDGDGGRVKKTQGTTTVYIGQLYVCTGTACAKLIYAGAQRVAMVQVNSGSTSYFHADHLGSTSGLTNANGTAEEHNSYEPYGDLHTHTGTSDVAYKYTGQERDASTDLYFYQARYYAQGLGRFVSPDSIVQNPLDPQAFNRYAYARNNPVRYTDPTGHYWWDDLPGPGDDLGGGYTPTPGVPVLDEVVVQGTYLPPESWIPNPFDPFGMDLLGTNLLGLAPWGPFDLGSFVSDPFVTLVGGAGDAGNYISEVDRGSIAISQDGILSFYVTTSLPSGAVLGAKLEQGFLKMDLSGNNAVNFRSLIDLSGTVGSGGSVHFQTSVYGIRGPAYLRIIPQYYPLSKNPPVITSFQPGGSYIPCNPCSSHLPYTQPWSY